jgi:ribonuclease Z
MNIDLRLLIAIWILCAVSLAQPTPPQAQPKLEPSELRVTLLGTGAGPPVNLKRYGPSLLVQAGSELLLFDCGRGALIRMTEAGVPLRDVTRLFLTHLHSDHTVDIPDLLLTPWAGRTARAVPLEVWGPKGTIEMMDHLQKAFAYDIHIRRDVDERFSPEGIKVVGHDIEQGTVYEKKGVKVTAFVVDHGPVKPAFGYRIDYAGRSVALSGDTRPSENLVEFAKGVDVLIHEALDPEAFHKATVMLTPQQQKSIIDHHTTPEQAGEVFGRVKPKLAVFSHTFGNPEILEKASKTYSGRMEMGEDLTTIVIGDTVTVQHSR